MQLLAQREHSRSELRRKLLPHAIAAANAAASAAEAAVAGMEDSAAIPPLSASRASAPGMRGGFTVPDEPVLSPEAQVDAVLDWLEANRYLSEARFVESRVHARASRFGNARIRQELAQHGVPIDLELSQQLKETEVARARDVWQRKFGHVPQDAAERAKQMRFLMGRGFSGEAVRRAVQGLDED